MVLLANGGAHVSRARGSRCKPVAHIPVGSVVCGRRLCTRYNRYIRRATVVVGQRSLVAYAAKARLLLLPPQQRIRLKSRLVPGGSTIPFHYPFRVRFEHLQNPL